MTQDHYEALGKIEAVEGGKRLDMFNRDHMIASIQRFPDGATVVVSIKVARDKRSDAQNRYLHGVVIPLFAAHCGYEFDDMKDALALELLPKELVDLKTGEVRIVPGHTSELDTKEFNDLIERAQRLGASMNLYIPDPNEAGYELPAKPSRARKGKAPVVTHYTDADAHVDTRGNSRALCGAQVNERKGETATEPACETCAQRLRQREDEPVPTWAQEGATR